MMHRMFNNLADIVLGVQLRQESGVSTKLLGYKSSNSKLTRDGRTFGMIKVDE